MLTASLPAHRGMPDLVTPRARHGGAPGLLELFASAFDELDYGLLIVDAGARLLHANQAGHQHGTDPQGACTLEAGHLSARTGSDDALLQRAIQQAARAARRSLLRLGTPGASGPIAVVPLGAGPDAVLVVFGKRQVCEVLSVEHYARVHGLTHAEGMVLAALCDGDNPAGIARRFGVAVSTVRSQIASIRQKTRAASIRDLVRQIAVLPPIMSAIGHLAPAH